MTTDQPDAGRRFSRRHLLLGGAAAGIGAAAAVGADLALSGTPNTPPAADGGALMGAGVIPFHGTHQAVIEAGPQAHATYLALDLHAGTTADTLRRMMQILSSDASRLTSGSPALADSEPELALVPARLTVTFGFGERLVAIAGGASAVPSWLRPLPAFTVDRLEEAWTGGDLLIHVSAEDPITVAHATRMLLKDTRTFGTIRWSQSGFRRAVGAEPPTATMRNLFGQVDGTVNATPGTDDFEKLVWARGDNPAWLAGGTGFVLRRIAMQLDKWDKLDRSGREQSVGRNLDNGAPLTGVNEKDDPDFEATTRLGFPVIPEFSHLRRARSENTDERIVRRGYNYDEGPTATGISDSGLIFTSYQADVDKQFVPLQRRIDEFDLLNVWITPIGSAVFAIPPGCAEGGYIGDTLF